MKKRQAIKFIKIHHFSDIYHSFDGIGRQNFRRYKRACAYIERKKRRCSWKKINTGIKKQFANPAWKNLAIVKNPDYGDINKVPDEIINLSFRDLGRKQLSFNLGKDERVKLPTVIYI